MKGREVWDRLWDRLLWGVVFTTPGDAPILIGRSWAAYLTAQVYYDGIYFCCAKGRGCKA